jgi:multicomponent Na+:H+ antiporter subunit B
MVIPLIKWLLIPLLGLVLAIFIISFPDYEEIYNNINRLYFQTSGYLDTGSKNIVTAIYLDYRLFDSIFEAGILLIAVSGVIWISHHDTEHENAQFMLDKFKTPELFITFSRIVYPIMLLFGFYIILNGHNAPGGGFQGGAVIASALLILFYIDLKKATNINLLLTIEKWLFIILLTISSISLITRGSLFTNFIPLDGNVDLKAIYLIILNIIIGGKVALGLTSIFIAFLKEGR